MRVFVTGASAWIRSPVVPEPIRPGHQAARLARPHATAVALTKAGADAVSGSLDDLDVLRSTVKGSDGVIHLAFSTMSRSRGTSPRRPPRTVGRSRRSPRS